MQPCNNSLVRPRWPIWKLGARSSPWVFRRSSRDHSHNLHHGLSLNPRRSRIPTIPCHIWLRTRRAHRRRIFLDRGAHPLHKFPSLPLPHPRCRTQDMGMHNQLPFNLHLVKPTPIRLRCRDKTLAALCIIKSNRWSNSPFGAASCFCCPRPFSSSRRGLPVYLPYRTRRCSFQPIAKKRRRFSVTTPMTEITPRGLSSSFPIATDGVGSRTGFSHTYLWICW